MSSSPLQSLARPPRRAAAGTHPIVSKFFRDRGPHLAAMVAYYALLSLVPFLFMALSLLGLAARPSESSALVRELQHILPGQSASSLVELVETVQTNAGTFGVIGFVGLVWGSLGFYSALESAVNIVFGVQNRGFLHGKWITFVLVMGSLLGLFVSLGVLTAATGIVQRHAPDVAGLGVPSFVATLLFTTACSFAFLLAVYRVLTNVEVSARDCLPGAITGTILFQASFSALPLFLRFSDALVALRAFGGLVILLVWLYLMANIIVLGAEITWAVWSRRQRDEELTGLA
jgi:membrane protein